VYPNAEGAKCEGSIYQDDGSSFAYREGKFFRQHFSCSEAADGSVTVRLDAPTGNFIPWWTQLRIEVYGLTSAQHSATANGKSASLEAGKTYSSVIVPAAAEATEVVIR
jgi:alpha-glucosidase